jgi:hypothetical protein
MRTIQHTCGQSPITQINILIRHWAYKLAPRYLCPILGNERSSDERAHSLAGTTKVTRNDKNKSEHISYRFNALMAVDRLQY